MIYMMEEMQEENDALVQHPDYQTEIEKILRSNLTPKHMRDSVMAYHENDIAATLDSLDDSGRERLYRILDTETLASVLEYSEFLEEHIGKLSMRKRVEILSQFEVSTAVEVLRSMPKADRLTVLDLLDEEIRHEIVLLSSFDEDEIGSKMSTNYISISAGLGVREAMRELICQAADNDNISTIYVVDDDETLVGAIDLKNLIIARENTPIETITMTSYPYVYVNEQIDACIERIKGYSEDTIPVLDVNHKLKGVLTSQTLTQLVGDALEEDYAKLAGLSAEEDLEEPLTRSVRKRLPWLLVLFVLGLFVSGIVGIFEKVVAELAIVVSFQSLVLGMSGNVGTQSLAVTIRVLMDDQFSRKQKWKLVFKEARVGLVNGVILGGLSFVLIGSYLWLIRSQPMGFAFSISLCTALALMISMVLSGVAGTIVPIIFKKVHIDPAVASGPLITTINDLVAIVSYYGLAWWLLLNVLQL